MGLKAVILSKIASYSAWKLFLLKALGFVALMFRKKVVFAAAFFTTFHRTFARIYEIVALGESGGLREVAGVLWVEAGDKFLGSLSHLNLGLEHLIQWDVIRGVWNLWTGAAAIYMLLFLWTAVFRGKVQNSEVEWPEQALVLAVLVSLTAVFEGSEVVRRLFENIGLLASGIFDVLYSVSDVLGSEGNVSEPGTGNVSSDMAEVNTS